MQEKAQLLVQYEQLNKKLKKSDDKKGNKYLNKS